MQQQEGAYRCADSFRLWFLAAVLALSGLPAVSQTATPAEGTPGSQIYARKNTLGIIGAYSWDSSHMLLGDAEQRMLVNIGVAYSRRLFLDRVVNWQYDGELLPVALESDPLSLYVVHQTSPTASTTTSAGEPNVLCSPETFSYTFTDPDGVTYNGTETILCSGRRWTIGEAMSPIGMQWNFLPEHKMQPFVGGHGGYMYTSQPIPIASAGSFNFTFDVGAGIEVFRSKSRSIRAEYRYHHISNHNTAMQNPGIDNGLLQITYCFRLGH